MIVARGSTRGTWRRVTGWAGSVGQRAFIVSVSGAALLLLAGPAAGTTPSTTYYVAMGASESVGVQPTPAHPRGAPSDDGYANDLLSIERSRWPGLQLVQFGCPGITAAEAADGGGRCPMADGSELRAAREFIAEHRDSTVLVTIDLGFNDLRPCMAHMEVDEPCVARALDALAVTVRAIVAGLMSAGARERVVVVGLSHSDPFLADARLGPTGAQFAAASAEAFDRFNGTLAIAYNAEGALVAPVPAALRSSAALRDPLTQDDLQAVCSLTWMCAPRPLGPNLHPTSAGYRVIADSIAATVTASLGPP